MAQQPATSPTRTIRTADAPGAADAAPEAATSADTSADTSAGITAGAAPSSYFRWLDLAATNALAALMTDRPVTLDAHHDWQLSDHEACITAAAAACRILPGRNSAGRQEVAGTIGAYRQYFALPSPWRFAGATTAARPTGAAPDDGPSGQAEPSTTFATTLAWRYGAEPDAPWLFDCVRVVDSTIRFVNAPTRADALDAAMRDLDGGVLGTRILAAGSPRSSVLMDASGTLTNLAMAGGPDGRSLIWPFRPAAAAATTITLLGQRTGAVGLAAAAARSACNAATDGPRRSSAAPPREPPPPQPRCAPYAPSQRPGRSAPGSRSPPRLPPP